MVQAEVRVGLVQATGLVLAQRFALSGVHNMAYDGAGRVVQADFLFGR